MTCARAAHCCLLTLGCAAHASLAAVCLAAIVTDCRACCFHPRRCRSRRLTPLARAGSLMATHHQRWRRRTSTSSASRRRCARLTASAGRLARSPWFPALSSGFLSRLLHLSRFLARSTSRSSTFLCFSLSACAQERHAAGETPLAALFRPACVHLCVTLLHVPHKEAIIASMRKAATEMMVASRAGTSRADQAKAGIYGVSDDSGAVAGGRDIGASLRRYQGKVLDVPAARL